MATAINDFKATLVGGGARANHFQAFLQLPQWVLGHSDAARTAQFLCHAAQLPSSNLGDISIPYRGREVHVAGERTFEPWTISIYNDVNFKIRDSLEAWIEGIQTAQYTDGRLDPLSYQMQMQVEQLDRNGNTIKGYEFVNAYPTTIGAIELSYDGGTSIESFDVTFTYDYWTTNVTV
jgi:hypothetical protein